MAISILVLSGIIILAWTGVRTPAIQNTIAQQIINRLAKTTGADISVGKVRYRMNKSLLIRNLLIKDEKQDTLLHIHRLETKITELDLNEKYVALNKVLLNEMYFKGEKINDTAFNFTFITDKLFKKEKNNFAWNIQCAKIELINATLEGNFNSGSKHYVSGFSFLARNLYADSTNLGFNMVDFKLDYNNKPFIDNLAFNVRKNKEQFEVNTFNLHLQQSQLNISDALFSLPNKQNTNFTYQAALNSAHINPNELKPFFKDVGRINFPFDLAFNIKGNNKEFDAKKLQLTFGKQTVLIGRLDANDLDKKGEENFYFQIENLITDAYDIGLFTHDVLRKDSSFLPPQLKLLGNIAYQGKLYGASSYLLTHGNIGTNLGNLATRLKMTQDKESSKLNIEGNIKVEPLNLASLTQDQQFGDLVMDIETKGFVSKEKGVQMDISGNIETIELKQTFYQDISFNGKLDDKEFTGKVNSYDPNLRFDFDGMLSFDSIPRYDFNSSVYYVNLFELGLDKKDPEANLSVNIDANFSGNNFDNSVGTIVATDLYVFKDSTYFATDSISILSSKKGENRQITLDSEYFTALLDGYFNTKNLFNNAKTYIGAKLPSLGISSSEDSAQSVLNFTLNAEYPGPITKIFLPQYSVSPGTMVSGTFNSRTQELRLSGKSDKLIILNRNLNDVEINAFTRKGDLFVNMTSNELSYSNANSLKNFLLSAHIKNDSIDLNTNWNNWLDVSYSGNINSMISFKPGREIGSPYVKLDLYPSNIIMVDTLWVLKRGSIEQDSSGFIINNFGATNGKSKVNLNGTLSDNPNDSLLLQIENISMTHLNVLLKNKPLKYNGQLSGYCIFHELTTSNKIDADLKIDNFSLNSKVVGNTQLRSFWNKNEKKLELQGYNVLADDTTFNISGYVAPSQRQIDLNFDLNGHPLNLLEAFLSKTFSNMQGTLDGTLKVHGNSKGPKWDGSILAKGAGFTLNPTHTFYTFNDTILFKDYDIVFDQITLNDEDDNIALVGGKISNQNLKFFDLDLHIATNKLLCLNSKYEDNPLYHGKVYASGLVDIYGPSKNLNIDIVATTLENSSFVLPIEGKGEIEDNNFISFINPQNVSLIENTEISNTQNELAKQVSTNIKMDLTITQDADIEIIMDPRVGDALKANGDAKLNIESSGSDFSIFGDYRIYKGDFIFTLQNVINKRFEIEQGSTVSWTGDPLAANIDVDAIYKIRKASVYDLTLDETDKENRVEVDCHLFLTEELSNPNINFAVNVPATTNNEAIDQLNSLPADDINKQVISLLLINRFAPLPGLTQNETDNFASGALTATTASELLSNQLSHWLSQITNDVDLGFTYRPGEEGVTAEEYEFALSTKLWNDRVIFNGNVGYGGQQAAATNQNAYTTDFTLELKLNKKGNVRLTAFQKVNNDLTIDYAPYTQGVGIFFTEEFNHFDDLLQKMFRKNAAQRPEDIELQNVE